MNADYELIKNIEKSIPCFDANIAGEGVCIEYPWIMKLEVFYLRKLLQVRMLIILKSINV